MWMLFNRNKENRKMMMAICENNSAGAQRDTRDEIRYENKMNETRMDDQE